MDKRVTDYFRRESDGYWTCVEARTVEHPSRRIQFTRGATFGPEDSYMGVKVAKWLDSLLDARRLDG